MSLLRGLKGPPLAPGRWQEWDLGTVFRLYSASFYSRGCGPSGQTPGHHSPEKLECSLIVGILRYDHSASVSSSEKWGSPGPAMQFA